MIDREWLSKEFGASVLPALIQTSQERRIRREKKGEGARLSYSVVSTDALFSVILQDLLALHTFGLVAPMCGLTIAVALAVKMLQFHYALERFRSSQPPEDVEALSADCRAFAQQTHPFLQAHPLILVFSSLFLSAFLVDVAGDAVGWKAAMWAPALMWVLPLSLSLLRARLFAKSDGPTTAAARDREGVDGGGVELRGLAGADPGDDGGSLGDLYGRRDCAVLGTMTMLQARASASASPSERASTMDALTVMVVGEHRDSIPQALSPRPPQQAPGYAPHLAARLPAAGSPGPSNSSKC